MSSGDITPCSPLQCRLIILPAPVSSGQDVGSLSFLVLTAAFRPPYGFQTCFSTLWVLRSSITLHLHHCYPPFFTFTQNFATHWSTLSPVTAPTSSAPCLLFFLLYFLLEDLVKNLNCSAIRLLAPQALSWLCTHHTSSSLDSSLISQDSPYSWILAWTPAHITSTPSCHSHYFLYLITSFAFSTTQLFSCMSQTYRWLNAAGENHKTTQICASKNSQCPISALLSNPSTCPWSAVSPFPTETIQYYFTILSPPSHLLSLSLLLGGLASYFTEI